MEGYNSMDLAIRWNICSSEEIAIDSDVYNKRFNNFLDEALDNYKNEFEIKEVALDIREFLKARISLIKRRYEEPDYEDYFLPVWEGMLEIEDDYGLIWLTQDMFKRWY